MRWVAVMLAACLACGDDSGAVDAGEGDAAEDAGADSETIDVGMDAGPAPMVLRYTPEGCDYEVHTPETESAERDGDVMGTTPPRHVHVGWAGSTSSTFNVVWESDVETTAGRVLYGLDADLVAEADAADAEVSEASGHTFVYRTARTSLIATELARMHETHICGLEPDTTYHYKVGHPGAWSEVHAFSTGPELGSNAPFRFATLGDSRGNSMGDWPVAQRALMEAGVDFQVFNGDAVFLGVLQGDWDGWFEASVDDFVVTDHLAHMPFMVSNGNHENLAVNLIAQFAMPQELSPGEVAAEEWYSFDYGNAHFVVLNDSVEEDSVIENEEAEWLRADLEAVDRDVTPWVFVTHHKATYTCMSTHSPNGQTRAAWQPIIDEMEVDMVLFGHNHVYERSRPIRGLADGEGVLAPMTAEGLPTFDAPGSGSGSPSGTVYVLSGAVGAPLYDVADTCPTSYVAAATSNYVVVDVVDRTITVVAYETQSGAELDRFTYTK